MEELFECGSCASVSTKVHMGDICIPTGAVRMEGVGSHYLPMEFPAVPNLQMVKALEEAAIEKGFPYDTGVTITKASFYTQTSPETKPIGPELIWRWESYVKGGATNTSMECAPLFLIAASLGIRASCVMVSATNCKEYSDQARTQPLKDLEDRAIQVAIEGMRKIIRQDLQK